MEINPLVVAGEDLIISGIRSPNYQSGQGTSPGSGWRIAQDGTAYFNDVSVVGQTTGTTASYTNIVANSSFIYKGTELQSILNQLSGGVVGWGQLQQRPFALSGTEKPILEVACTTYPGQMYRIDTAPVTCTGNAIAARLWFTTDGTQPNIGTGSSQLLNSAIFDVNTTGRPGGLVGIPSSQSGPGQLRVLLSGLDLATGGSISYPDGASGFEIYIENQGLFSQPTGVNRTGGSSQPQFHSFQSYASNAYSFIGGSGANFGSTSVLYQGQSPYGPDGNQFSLIWFPNLNLLSGIPLSSYSYFDVFLYYSHWYYSAGGTAIIGTNNSAFVSGFPPISAFPSYTQNCENQPYNGVNIGQWVSLLAAPQFQADAQAGTLQGIILGQGPNTSFNYYGYVPNIPDTNAPQIRAGWYQ